MTNKDLKELRAKLKLTQRRIAFRLGVTERTYQRWEHGETEIPSPVELALKHIEENPQ